MKPGLKTIIAGILLLFCAVMVFPLFIVVPFFLQKSDDVQFKVPGGKEVTVKEPGRYYLWNNFNTVYEGKSYAQSEAVPNGMTIEIRDESGHLLPFVSNNLTTVTTEGNNENSKKSIGYVQIDHPEKLEIQVSGGNEERIFSFSKSDVLKIFLTIFGAVSIAALTGLPAIGLIIWGIIKLNRRNKTATPPPFPR